MKRDMDLVRDLLMALEKQDSYDGFTDLSIEGYSEDQISYHVLLIHEAGLIEAMDMSTFGGPSWKPVRLSWEGHEFLDASRDDSRWSAAKAPLAMAGGGLAFEVLKLLLISSLKQAVGLAT